MAMHLNECASYQAILAGKAPKSTQKKLSFTQQPVKMRQLSKEDVEKLEKLAGYTVYCGARPFSTYSEAYMKSFIAELEPAFEIPDRKAFAGRILDLCYNETKSQVEEILGRTRTINLITDESSNMSRDRIINLCISTPSGPFCIKYEAIPVGTWSAQRQTKWLNDQLDRQEESIGHKLPPVNSVATDTCRTMRSLWEELRRLDRFRYTFFVPCDSHGLQLLIKDIVNLHPFDKTMKEANMIVTHFRCAHKQLALLRHYQRETYGQEYALTLACETRWGTQHNVLSHLKRSKDALKAFARDINNECDPAILEPINEYSFWASVDELLDILKPIHEAQIASESSDAHLGYVKDRWSRIKETLQYHRESYDLLTVFKARRAVQLLPIHLVAFHLDPRNVHQAFNVGDQTTIFKFIKTHTPSEQHISIQRAFLNFKRMRQGFESSELWEPEVVNDPYTFWQFASEYSPDLADLAMRLFETPANSVPSERAFSTMNLTHTRHRNRLKVEKVDKICYIHINRRILDRKKEKGKAKTRLDQLNDEEALEREESLPELITNEWNTNEFGGRRSSKRKLEISGEVE